ncbi:MAG: DMT family transporter [Pseudomonadota bacterium]
MIRWWNRLSPILRAATLMLLGGSCVAVQLSAIRIASETLHPFEIAFFRNLVGLLMILPFLGRTGLYGLRTTRPGRLAVSSVGLLAAMVCFFFAIADIPLAEVMALSFTKPLFATLGAALLLREVVRARRWTAVLIGFLGVIIVLRPGTEAISPYALLVLASALVLAGVAIMIKQLTTTESAPTIVFYQSVFMALMSVPLAMLYWQTPNLPELGILIVVGVLGTVSWLCVARAFALVDASVVMPFEFARLPLTALVAYLMFAEVPTIWTWIGGTVIFGSTIYITHREFRAGSSASPTTEARAKSS